MKWWQGKLLFPIYKKEGQQLKYVDRQSTHRPSTFWSITNRVLKRLSQLTSRSEDLKEVGINKVYPGHAGALSKAGLAEQHFPTFGEVWSREDLEAPKEKKKQRHDR
eukprot:12356116-Ditylum_brightwellii.AAC.1